MAEKKGEHHLTKCEIYLSINWEIVKYDQINTMRYNWILYPLVCRILWNILFSGMLYHLVCYPLVVTNLPHIFAMLFHDLPEIDIVFPPGHCWTTTEWSFLRTTAVFWILHLLGYRSLSVDQNFWIGISLGISFFSTIRTESKHFTWYVASTMGFLGDVLPYGGPSPH